jgi:hypothetical protein
MWRSTSPISSACSAVAERVSGAFLAALSGRLILA